MTDLLEQPVHRSMARVLSALSPSTSIPAARKLLAEQHLSGAPVVDSEGRLLGVVSQKDLLADLPSTGPSVARYHVLHDGKMLTETAIPGVEAGGGRVEEVMTREVLTITEETPLREAMRRMVVHEIHRLLVVREGQLVGLVSTMDVLRALVPDRPAAADQGF
jgi:CBS domain-containing protein